MLCFGISIFVAAVSLIGNHERFLDAAMFSGLDDRSAVIPRLDKSCVYLEDSTAIVHGIRVFGSPWSVL